MIPRWLPFIAIFLLLAGWAAVVWTLTAMIRDRRARRLAAEAAEAARQLGDAVTEVASTPGTMLPTREL